MENFITFFKAPFCNSSECREGNSSVKRWERRLLINWIDCVSWKEKAPKSRSEREGRSDKNRKWESYWCKLEYWMNRKNSKRNG